MVSQLQTPSHGFGGASSIFDTSPGSDNTKAFSGVLQPTYPVAAQTAATNPPTTWYRYWNEQYNRYFFWQENNSISTWDLPPEGDIVVDYTTKEVVSGPGSSSSGDGADSAVQQQQRQDSGHSNTYPPPDDSISQTVLGEYDQSVSSSAAAGLFGPATGGPAAAATVDFDLLARGGRPADVSSRVFEESSPADLSWLHKGMPGGGSISGFNPEPAQQQQQQQHSGVPAPSSFSPADGDNLFPSLSASMRSALDEVAGPQGVVTNDYGITETYPVRGGWRPVSIGTRVP
ncbi:hypothetical protein FOZ63_011582 [Perkinsus olseni]|uniref:WW domain-containing protein n=1 Tax=Perkinsus olseni TaxID=32597 RepID=A0A7J6RAR9_PEROL|nr:hypothetical protein FOZ63_011582 [Perkinsus olseni]